LSFHVCSGSGYTRRVSAGMFADIANLLATSTKDDFMEEVMRLGAFDKEQRLQAMGTLVLLRDQVNVAIAALAENTCILQGWLLKKKLKGNFLRSSLTSGTHKKRYCVVQPDGLHYFKDKDGEKLGVILNNDVESCISNGHMGKNSHCCSILLNTIYIYIFLFIFFWFVQIKQF
jgi:hypothetical protein